MSSEMPGAFPTIPSSSSRAFDQKTPTASDFRFTPLSSMSGVRKQLYPNISHLQSHSDQGNELEKEFKDLGYSNTLSTKVLSELDQRAATKSSSVHSRSNMLSPRSSRYNSSHRSKFQKLESISSHYAATRRLRQHVGAESSGRQQTEVDKENVPSYAPYSKRSGATELTGATKRRKTEAGVKEIPVTLSPSKAQTNLQGILNPGTLPREIKEAKPTKPILKPSEKRTIRPSPSSSNFSRPTENKTIRSSKSISNFPKTLPRSSTTASFRASKPVLETPAKEPLTLRHTTSTRTLSRSSTLSNLAKPTASSMSRSSTSNNLAQTLRTKPSKEVMTSRIPRSKSTVNDKNTRPLWR